MLLFSNVVVSRFWTRYYKKDLKIRRRAPPPSCLPSTLPAVRFCILQAIKSWMWGRPGNEANSWPHRQMVPYSRKLSREKTFANFAVLWLFTKVYFGAAKASNPRKFSAQKSYFSPIRRKFSPLKVSRYMVASPGAAVLSHLITLNLLAG